MTNTLNHPVSRRTMLRRLGVLGAAVPAFGALGIACSNTDDLVRERNEAQQALVERNRATPAPVASTDHNGHGDPPAQPIASQDVTLDYLPNPEAAAPVERSEPQLVRVELETQEVEGKLADGAGYRFWTFNGTVPGPMIRVMQGDDVELTLRNAAESTAIHNIDLHAVTGPGGGATLTDVGPGEEKTFRFKALHPGVFVYHCATAPVDLHISNGMYGLIVVEPPGGLPAVDREFYVMQGELYTGARAGTAGMQTTDMDALADERPSYVVFNGAMGSITNDRALRADVGETARIFFGVGGPNLTSSFHVIGEVFDRVASLGSLTAMTEDVQTVTVPPGGATMVELSLQVPGTYVLVDHALSRLNKGAAGHLVVEGEEDPSIFGPA